MNLISGALIVGVGVLPVVLLSYFSSKPRHGFYAFLFWVILMADIILTSLPQLYGILDIQAAKWNWVGKMFSLLLCLTVIAGSKLSLDQAGFSTSQRGGSVLPSTILTILLIGAGLTFGYNFGDELVSKETLAYHLTLVGIAEEVAYRGVFLGLLHKAFPARRRDFTYWWPAIIVTLAYGLYHGIDVNNGTVLFDFNAFLFPFALGIALVWMRERTESLMFPILAHNATYTAFYLGGVLWL